MTAIGVTDHALVVTEVTKHYGGVAALDGCTLAARSGQITGLIGPNGAGKSTLIDVISGFAAADTGNVRLAGQDVTNWKPYRISRAGVVRTFQATAEWSTLSATENVLVAASGARGGSSIMRSLFRTRAYRTREATDREAAVRFLENVELAQKRNMCAGMMSGGERRLIELARIASTMPSVVLLDEPLVGVNPRLHPSILKIMQGFASAGAAVVLVEHNLAFVEEACNLIHVMANGRLLASGAMTELRGNHLVSAAYIGL